MKARSLRPAAEPAELAHVRGAIELPLVTGTPEGVQDR